MRARMRARLPIPPRSSHDVLGSLFSVRLSRPAVFGPPFALYRTKMSSHLLVRQKASGSRMCRLPWKVPSEATRVSSALVA